MRAERYVARVFHHVGQEVAEHRILERVQLDVALPNGTGALDVALRVSVEHVLQQFGRHFVHMLEADDRPRYARFDPDPDRALGDVLGKVAYAFEIAGDADRAYDFTQVHRHRLPSGDGEDRLLLDLALQGVEAGVGGDDLLREPGVGAGQRIHRVDYHLLRDAAHFGDAALERAEFIIIGLDGVIDHWSCSLSRIGG